MSVPSAPGRPHILIIGGGFLGMSTARRLQRRLRRGEADVTVVDPQPTMTYQPFLAEVAAGSIEARHVVVSLRALLPGCRMLTGALTALDHRRRVATLTGPAGATTRLTYDHLVLAVGAVSRTLPIPGLAEEGIGFTTVGEAVWLRNHVLSQLDVAAATGDSARRRRSLTFVVVGGGYAGVELIAELQDMTRRAIRRRYPELDTVPTRWVLVDAADRILPEVSAAVAGDTERHLAGRGIDVRLRTRVESMVGGRVALSDGTHLDADTVVWTAGVRPNPVVARLGLPIDDDGRLACTPQLHVDGTTGVWAAGDCAAVPDLSRPDDPDAICGASAQHAVRQAGRLAANLLATLRGRPLTDYRHAYAGSVAGLGLHRGIAEIYGVRLRGWPAWLLHRVYHLTRVPTLSGKARVLADWTLALLLRRVDVSLDQVQHPRAAWESSQPDAA